MATVMNGSAPPVTDPGSTRAMPTAPRVPAPRSRRRPALLALGVALVAVGALVAAWLVSSAGQKTPVLALAHDVPFGTVLSSTDLTVTDVSVDPSVPVVAATDESSVVGMTAATALTAGSLLSRASLTPAGPPTAGQLLVGLAVPANRMPASGLAAGDRILVVDTPSADADPPTGPPATIAATVVRVGSADLNGVTVVDVTVATGDGPALAARAATGRIAVVVEPRSS